MMSGKGAKPTVETATALGLDGLAFLAEDGPRLGRFLALTGMGPDELRAAADAPETLLAVLEHLLGDESLLLVFAASRHIPPESLLPAHALLCRQFGGGQDHE